MWKIKAVAADFDLTDAALLVGVESRPSFLSKSTRVLSTVRGRVGVEPCPSSAFSIPGTDGAIVAALLAGATACSPTAGVGDPTPPGRTVSAEPSESQLLAARVVSVTDGDTIRVDIAGMVYPLRYIGIDSPETVDPNSPVQWMAQEASAANEALVGGRAVYLERDVSDTDDFGRLLRYVYLDSGAMVNEELVRLGYAYASTYPPDVRHQARLQAAQAEAMAEARGLWGPTPTPSPAIVVPLVPPLPGDCDPSYPGVCIPPPPPDLDCRDVTHRRFRVVPPDPHGFDGNYDGVGCEG